MASLIAALSSAEFYITGKRKPGSVKYHAIIHRRDGLMGAACGVHAYDETTQEPAFGLLDSEKCERAACRKAFEADKETPQ